MPDGSPYFVMQHLQGQSLGDVLRARGRLTPAEVVSALRPMAVAVDAAHAHGIIHRDLKRDNIFVVDLPGGGKTVKVLDFGVAKLTSTTMTATGGLIGTPLVMAPEQCAGAAIDHRADVYAFGVIAYHALTGRFPLEVESVVQLVTAHLQRTQPSPPSAHGADGQLDGPIMRCLSWDPADRPATLSAALDGIRAPTDRRSAAAVAETLAASTARHPAVAPAATVAPVAPLAGQTTLGAAAGTAQTSPAPVRKRTLAILITVLAIVAAATGVTAYWLATGDRSASPAGPAAAPTAAAVSDAAPLRLATPRVAIDQWSTGKAIDGARARTLVASQIPALEQCFLRRLAVEPQLTARVDVGLRVDRRGAPQDLTVVGPDAELSACTSASVTPLRRGVVHARSEPAMQ